MKKSAVATTKPKQQTAKATTTSKPASKFTRQQKPAPQQKPTFLSAEDMNADDFDSDDFESLDFNAGDDDSDESDVPPPKTKKSTTTKAQPQQTVKNQSKPTNDEVKIEESTIKPTQSTKNSKQIPLKPTSQPLPTSKIQPANATKRKNNPAVDEDVVKEELQVVKDTKKSKTSQTTPIQPATTKKGSKNVPFEVKEEESDDDGDFFEEDFDWGDEDEEIDIGDYMDDEDDEDEDDEDVKQEDVKMEDQKPTNKVKKQVKQLDDSDDEDQDEDDEAQDEKEDEEIYGWKLNSKEELLNEEQQRRHAQLHFQQLCESNDRKEALRQQRIKERQAIAKEKRKIKRYNSDLRVKLAVHQNYKPHRW
jgi:hypothetical protein